MNSKCYCRPWFDSVLALAMSGAALAQAADGTPPRQIAPPNDIVFQFPAPRQAIGQVTTMLHVATARSQFNVDGTGLTAAVIDTGLRTTHLDFVGKVAAQKNFTSDNGGNSNNAADGEGHGTNVAGIICANGIHTGMAPGAKVIPLKVLSNNGSGTFASVVAALDWVIANRSAYNISVVNMSLGDSGNYTSDSIFSSDTVRQRITTLRGARVAVCVAAGNDFYENGSREGMSYPAVCRESISVGATFDANLGRVSYYGPIAYTTDAGRITPFSQRLHSSTNSSSRTDILAPGAALTSAGIQSDQGESTAHGTSQATPVTAGLVLLAQQYWKREKGSLPTVDQLETWLRRSKYSNVDGDNEDDNVGHNFKSYINADAIELLAAVQADLGGSTPPPPPPPPTNNVVASYNLATRMLTLTGNAAANSVSVTYQFGRITVSGTSGTTINSKTTAFVAYAPSQSNLTVNTGAGNDSIVITGAPVGTMLVSLGDGNDSLRLTYCTVSYLSLNGGNGTDAYTTLSSTVTRKTVTGVP
jgi:subtilase family protein